MKKDTILILAAAALGLFAIKRMTGGTATVAGKTTSLNAGPVNTNWTSEIFNSAGTPFDNGWRYYSDGTSIGPDGTYYLNGTKVWAPA